MKKHRIELLDGFRFIAVMSVLFYHFTSLWMAKYPYGDLYHRIFHHVFDYGFLGVQFFFMISGFVISYTLENTAGLLSFYRNRFVRLFPPMLLCSVLTFLAVHFLDREHLFKNAHEIKNFLPGLTFINPTFWTLVTGTEFHWMNGSYWSLWVEVQFYIVSSGLYYFSKRHFFRNMLLAGIVISSIKYIPGYFLNNQADYLELHHLHDFFDGWRYGDEIFNLTFYISWFICGVFFYQLYKGINLLKDRFLVICSGLMLFCLVHETRAFFADSFVKIMIAGLLMFAVFLLMIYKEGYLSFLKNPLFIRIGMISYSIYLIHEEIGVLLITRYGKYLGSWSALAPLIMIIIAVCFAELSYRFYERRAALLLKCIFVKNNSEISPFDHQK